MRLQDITITEKNYYADVIRDAVVNKKEVCIHSIVPRNFVYKGVGEIDEELAEKNGYQVYYSYDFGGGIVATKGDLVLAIVKHEGWEVGKNLLEKICQYLKDKGLPAEIDGNDILISGKYKVASHSSRNIGDRYIYTGLQVCFHANPELIERICLKPSKKIPRGLASYGLSNVELMEQMLEWVVNDDF